MDNINIIESIDSFIKVYPKLEKASIYHQDASIIRLIGLDCEMISKNNLIETYEKYLSEHSEITPCNDIVICKIIIYTERLCIIVDLAKFDCLPKQLIEILKNDSWIKTGVGISNDFTILSHNYSLGMLVGCIELKNIGILCGIQNPNLLELYKLLINDNQITKSKNSSFDWSQELTLSQIKYARNDGYMSYIVGKKILQQLCPIIQNTIKQNIENNITQNITKTKNSLSTSSDDDNLYSSDNGYLSENNNYDDLLIEKMESIDNINYIGKLQEHSQKNNIPLPKYEECGVLESSSQFKFTCFYQDYCVSGFGKTKKEAKRQAAYLMYNLI